MAVGEQITIEGRLQSRPYQKQMTDGSTVEKTAYEVSVGRLESLRQEDAVHTVFPQPDEQSGPNPVMQEQTQEPPAEPNAADYPND